MRGGSALDSAKDNKDYHAAVPRMLINKIIAMNAFKWHVASLPIPLAMPFD
jgi:hypothetical protein